MWIASKYGYYSIVRKAEQWHVRARLRGDLQNLVAAAGLPTVTIHQSQPADYRWRIVIDRDSLDRVFETLCSSVDYPNFKSMIARSPDQRPKLAAYHDIWDTMHRLQR